MKTPAISEEELHAYADGQLPASRAGEIAAWLEQDPAHAAELQQVRAWRAQNRALHAHYDPVLEEALPPRLAAAVLAGGGEEYRRRDEGAVASAADSPLWWRYAAMLLLTLAGGLGGWYLRDFAAGSNLRTQVASAPVMLARQAAVAHTVFSADLRRPVEVGADQEQALVTWLSRRLGANVRAPKLAPLGYDLIGGRLLPGQSGPVAQFMYQDAAGQRLTLYVSHDQVQNRETGFRFAQEGRVNVFYWIDGQFGYALSGSLARPELSRIASSVYEQLAPVGLTPPPAVTPAN
ncbi:anti-sigma factor [Herbaspirillum sp. AP02]|uniref:anti-sigma factor family protein n=1 Tax=unclassified Herbaspirillum TaxID=2624150 RepID=UPI0015DB4E4C|nr:MULTISPECIES: anti-sigma factor [unclassified Herbaspirillum]MBG7619935.1 anti-sigma factor [Herbaspirillum sp. AP02]NZD69001.1 anti-sigma factor [Herbaspirillum sp. AP21]